MDAARLLVRTLQSLGTRYLFSLSGNQIMSIYDAWIDSNIELIHVRHEAAAVHMADAWGRLTGTPGVALLTAGPGHANALSAMYVALMAESPVVVISGHAPLSDLGQRPFQEMDQVNMALPVAKASWLVREPNSLGDEVMKAFRIANSGRPGPVHMSIPMDVLEAESTAHDVEPCKSAVGEADVDAKLVDHVVAAISQAERPLVLTGPALMRSKSFRNASSIFADAGLPLIGMESPRGLSDPTLGRFSDVLPEADLLLLLGKKLDFTLKLGKAPFIDRCAHIIQVDPDASVLTVSERNMQDRVQLLQTYQSDPQPLLKAMTKFQEKLDIPRRWTERTAEALAFRPPEWKGYRSSDEGRLHPVQVGYAIEDFLSDADDPVFVSDGGEFGQWMQACVGTDTRVINGPSGAIGSAIPFGVAARLARPSSRIISCTGDGAFGFHPFELDTAVRYDIPFVTVIGNDACWNAEYQIQLNNYGSHRSKGCELLSSKYHEVASALGAWGRYVKTSEDIPTALIAAEQSGLPACLNVPITREPMPK